jgi:hypothetical protein
MCILVDEFSWVINESSHTSVNRPRASGTAEEER